MVQMHAEYSNVQLFTFFTVFYSININQSALVASVKIIISTFKTFLLLFNSSELFKLHKCVIKLLLVL